MVLQQHINIFIFFANRIPRCRNFKSCSNFCFSFSSFFCCCLFIIIFYWRRKNTRNRCCPPCLCSCFFIITYRRKPLTFAVIIIISAGKYFICIFFTAFNFIGFDKIWISYNIAFFVVVKLWRAFIDFFYRVLSIVIKRNVFNKLIILTSTIV